MPNQKMFVVRPVFADVRNKQLAAECKRKGTRAQPSGSRKLAVIGWTVKAEDPLLKDT